VTRGANHSVVRKAVPGRRGFSLVELVTVLAVVAVLTGLLLPALIRVRESVNRVVSASNLRQIGFSVTLYDRDYGVLPVSRELMQNRPAEMMIAHRPQDGWDGLGLLFGYGYIGAMQVFYSPSHHGDHPLSRYEDQWHNPTGQRIYVNYHYGGHVDWSNHQRMRSLLAGDSIVIATDGLRTRSDFNHRVGMNLLRGDGSVRWRSDSKVQRALPITLGYGQTPPQGLNEYINIFQTIERTSSPTY